MRGQTICVMDGCLKPAEPLPGYTLCIRTTSKQANGTVVVDWKDVSASHGGCPEKHKAELLEIANDPKDQSDQRSTISLRANQQLYFFRSPEEMAEFTTRGGSQLDD